ncbi:hypothetical protein HHK36_024832 [Tetracentron sinense]|uniref:Uncharacterized protein n=1 Tax=Tetracentron sinense TaxID=13715 RepID=A0A834YQQ9_TETSI|nr:hypothetical protein HHK36_024832 [Tetracentron sinense]
MSLGHLPGVRFPPANYSGGVNWTKDGLLLMEYCLIQPHSAAISVWGTWSMYSIPKLLQLHRKFFRACYSIRKNREKARGIRVTIGVTSLAQANTNFRAASGDRSSPRYVLVPPSAKIFQFQFQFPKGK